MDIPVPAFLEQGLGLSAKASPFSLGLEPCVSRLSSAGGLVDDGFCLGASALTLTSLLGSCFGAFSGFS